MFDRQLVLDQWHERTALICKDVRMTMEEARTTANDKRRLRDGRNGATFAVSADTGETLAPEPTAVRYVDLVDSLRAAYDGGAARRDRMEKTPWKLDERARFMARLRERHCTRLLEIGAGTGQDSLFFQDHGLDVVATDLSPAMVSRCREKGLDARVMDFLHLDFSSESFDAVYALNCLLHVPNADLPVVLQAIRAMLRPGGLFFLGVYGGQGDEGIAEDDVHDPPRFFSLRTDEQIQQLARQSFDIVDFHTIEHDEIHFQSLTLSRSA
jgi:SAM-dependent methyltransferase